LLLEDDSSILLEPINPTEDFSAEFPREIYYIDRKSAENREIVEFELASVYLTLLVSGHRSGSASPTSASGCTAPASAATPAPTTLMPTTMP
jgi:hypothetical protein